MVIESEREMENNELEEGEACSYNGNNISGRNYDPDVALAYIGDKLQDVLGHLQKDFEGGVSAEYLGTKFGGYGSFLNDRQQSPLWSQSRSPSEQNYSASKPPIDFQVEDEHRNSKVSLSGNQSVGNGSAKSGAKLLDHKGIKVKIKMNCDNLKTQKNAAVYSGLGLDVSPTSSLGDDSLLESKAVSAELQYGQENSPNNILQVMMSFPLQDEVLLSPLPEDILHLTKKKRPVSRTMLATGEGSDPSKSERKMARGKSMKPLPSSYFSEESKMYRNKKCIATSVPKKEVDIDGMACDELVSKTLRLPLLSDADARKCTPEASSTPRESHTPVERNKIISIGKVDVLKPEASRDKCWAEKVKLESSGSILQNKKEISLENHKIHPNKGYCKKEGKKYKSIIGKEMEQMDSVKQKDLLKAASHEHESTILPGKEFLSSDCKRKLKGSQTPLTEELAKRVSRTDPFPLLRNKGTNTENYTSKRESEDLRSTKVLQISRDRYKEFFGDINFEEEEHQEESPLITPVDSHKNFEMAVKSTDAVNSAVEGKTSSKKGVKPSTTGAKSRRDFDVTAQAPSLPSFDSLNAPVAPVVIEDNWVQCDKCQKWRLLPVGRNPDSLPEKWLCAMLDWLPGMNKCAISEEETTKALYALYQVPVPEKQNNAYANTGLVVTSADTQSFCQNSNLLEPNGRKKKYKLKETLDAMNGEEHACFSNSVKKNMKNSSMKGRHLNDVKKSPLVSLPRSQQASKPSDLNVEKQQHKQTALHMSDGCFSDGGNPKKSKVKRKREHDLDHSRPSKNNSIEGTKSFEEGCTINNEAHVNVGSSFSNTSHTALGKGLVKYRNSVISKDKGNSEGSLVPSRKSNDKLQVSLNHGSPIMESNSSKDKLIKKRKVNGSATILSGTRHNLQDTNVSVDGLSDNNECRERKKARLSNCEGRESRTGKGHGKPDKRGSQSKNQSLVRDNKITTSSQRILNRINREVCIIHPSMTATSSSSKVSGSQKSRTNIQEVKGSPVESVSSSPLRIQNRDKGLVTKNKEHKDGCDRSGYHRICSPCKFAAEEEGGSDQFGDVRTEKHFSVPSHGVIEPLMRDFQNRDFDVNVKMTVESCDELRNSTPSHELKPAIEVQESLENRWHGLENKYVGKKESSRRRSHDNSQGDSKYNSGRSNGLDVKQDTIHRTEGLSTPSKFPNIEGGRSSRRSSFDKTERDTSVSGKGQSLPLPPAGVGQHEALTCETKPVLDNQKGLQTEKLGPGTMNKESKPKLPKKVGKAADHVEGQNISSRHSMENGRKARDHDALSPHRKESSSQSAARTLREATDLKHLADKLKNTGANNESTGLYFQAVLKFLNAASLMESSYVENSRHGDMIQSMQVYSSTAKLCEFCAHEYEKAKDMSSAALAYKCMEVAYMRVVYSSRISVSRERQELLTALQMVAPGESPSSSISDVDNMNNLTSVEKAALAKGTDSPIVSANNVIAGRNRTNFVRLLNFTQDVSFAMEASRKCRSSFAAANVNLIEGQLKEGITPVKRALDFNFQDVEGFLRLVRLAMEAISH